MAGFGIVPFFRPWYDDVSRSHSLYDQFFAQPLFDDDLLAPLDYLALGLDGGRRRHGPEGQRGPLRPSFDRLRSGLSHVKNDKNEFKVSLDVQQFKPEEIQVKTDEKYVTIEGKHEEKPDEHGFIQRHFVRRYMLPGGVKPEDVKCSLSSDGVLSVAAPKQQALEAGQKERVVPIAQSPHPALQQGQGAQGQGQQQQVEKK
jgi:crystallin alpha B